MDTLTQRISEHLRRSLSILPDTIHEIKEKEVPKPASVLGAIMLTTSVFMCSTHF